MATTAAMTRAWARRAWSDRAQLGAVTALLGLPALGRSGDVYRQPVRSGDAVLATLPPPAPDAQRFIADRRS